MAPFVTYLCSYNLTVLTLFLFNMIQFCFANPTDCINSYGVAVQEYNASWYDEFKKRKSNAPFHVYIHTVTSGHWLNILVDMILDMDSNDFYEQATSITIGVIGGHEPDFQKGRKYVGMIACFLYSI